MHLKSETYLVNFVDSHILWEFRYDSGRFLGISTNTNEYATRSGDHIPHEVHEDRIRTIPSIAH
jgi:hypothetical protein